MFAIISEEQDFDDFRRRNIHFSASSLTDNAGSQSCQPLVDVLRVLLLYNCSGALDAFGIIDASGRFFIFKEIFFTFASVLF